MGDMKEDELYHELLNKKNDHYPKTLKNCNKSTQFLSKAASENKKLVSLLNKKMFKGFRQIKASKDFGKSAHHYVKRPYWEGENLYPFNDNYELMYKRKYFNTKKENTLNPYLKVTNTSKELNEKKKNETFFIYNHSNGERGNVNFFMTDKYIDIQGKEIEKKDEVEQKKKLLNTIFQNGNEEAEKYSILPFFALNIKNPMMPATVMKNAKIVEMRSTAKDSEASKHETDLDQNNQNEEKEKMDKTTQSEFLYKISHGQKIDSNSVKSISNSKGNSKINKGRYKFEDDADSNKKSDTQNEKRCDQLILKVTGTSEQKSLEEEKKLNFLKRHFDYNLDILKDLQQFNDMNIESSSNNNNEVILENPKENNTKENYIPTTNNESFFSNKITQTKNKNYANKKCLDISNPNKPTEHIIQYDNTHSKNIRILSNEFGFTKKDRFNQLKTTVFGPIKDSSSNNTLQSSGFTFNKRVSKMGMTAFSSISTDSHLLTNKKYSNFERFEKDTKLKDYFLSKQLYNDFKKEDIDLLIYGKHHLPLRSSIK